MKCEITLDHQAQLTFDDLAGGDVFVIQHDDGVWGKDAFLKLSRSLVAESSSIIPDRTRNAVWLTDGFPCRVTPTRRVALIDAELVATAQVGA